ncbi:hypothetical protein F2Q70_00021565 [Brassica cretica]|uniref:DUF1985 domain-containing protein n=4 Tax=Brassica TaxID=3705 RepID=A0A8S9GVX1_BRACR|nr:hypothetical protein F2Q70_00021565 [Brassica cretica]
MEMLELPPLNDDEYEELKESKLGVFIKFQELGFDWASRLVPYMLGFQLDIKKKYELWSLVGPQPAISVFPSILSNSSFSPPVISPPLSQSFSPPFSQPLPLFKMSGNPSAHSLRCVSLNSAAGKKIWRCQNSPKALHDDEYEELKESKFGVFIKFQEMGYDWASRLVHYMLGFQLDIKKKYELWSLVGPEPVRFSLLEFENLTDLNFEYIEDLERPHCVVTKELTSFWEMLGVHVQAGPSTQEIITTFERCEGWSRDDRKRLAYLAIFTGYIEGRKYSTPTRVSLARLVMELERFENYPWGRVAFKAMTAPEQGGSSPEKEGMQIGATESNLIGEKEVSAVAVTAEVGEANMVRVFSTVADLSSGSLVGEEEYF